MRNMPPNLPIASRRQLGGTAKGEWEGAPESASQFAIGVWGELGGISFDPLLQQEKAMSSEIENVIGADDAPYWIREWQQHEDGWRAILVGQYPSIVVALPAEAGRQRLHRHCRW